MLFHRLDIDEEFSSDDEVSDSSTSSPSMTKAIYSTSEKSIENSGIKSINKRVVESVEPNDNNVENTSDIKTRYEQLQKHDETLKIQSENSKIQFEKSVKHTETSPSRNDDTCTSSNAENDKKVVQNEATSGKLEEEKSVSFLILYTLETFETFKADQLSTVKVTRTDVIKITNVDFYLDNAL